MVQIINYGFVVRGVIDGGTRRCCLLTVSDSNNPTGWCKDFISAIRERGVPSRVRADRGGENNKVRALMLRLRGLNRGSFIPGRSVHNQRIERFWRDWREKCGQAYLQLFELMVNDHDMDMTNPFHKYCLQAMFFTSLQDFEIHGTIT
jgi:hypothetical protein